jgi:hypothetical protein
LVRDWVSAIGLDPSSYGTHSLRRTKAALIYRKTGNLRAVQLLLGHTKVDSTVRYLGVELEDALSIAERIDVGRCQMSGASGVEPFAFANPPIAAWWPDRCLEPLPDPTRFCCTRAQHVWLQLVLGSVLQRRRKSRHSLLAR